MKVRPVERPPGPCRGADGVEPTDAAVLLVEQPTRDEQQITSGNRGVAPVLRPRRVVAELEVAAGLDEREGAGAGVVSATARREDRNHDGRSDGRRGDYCETLHEPLLSWANTF